MYIYVGTYTSYILFIRFSENNMCFLSVLKFVSDTVPNYTKRRYSYKYI